MISLDNRVLGGFNSLSRMKILHVNQMAGRGGAAGICLALHQSSIAAGHESAVLVGRQARELPGVRLIEHDRYRSAWGRFWMAAARRIDQYSGRFRGAQRVSERWIPRLASPRRFWSWWAGHEDFDFPGTSHLLDQVPFMPDLLHLHNLHGDYFDLRELPRLSNLLPTVITMHDAWMLSGHCVHSLDCQLWEIGCTSCPYPTLNRPLRRDGAATNWSIKKRIYLHSAYHVVCPSKWLADRVAASPIHAGTRTIRVIPNGVDTKIFNRGNKTQAKSALGLPADRSMVLVSSDNLHKSTAWPYIRDYATLRAALARVAELPLSPKPLFCAVGKAGTPEQVGKASVLRLPAQVTPTAMARVYQAADVYVHSMCSDNHPTSLLESMACGTPIIASCVGGIPEQVRDGETGYLVQERDVDALASRLYELLCREDNRSGMGESAARDAMTRFSLTRMLSEYVNIYNEAIADFPRMASKSST